MSADLVRLKNKMRHLASAWKNMLGIVVILLLLSAILQ
jgi:hypothetical protein